MNASLGPAGDDKTLAVKALNVDVITFKSFVLARVGNTFNEMWSAIVGL